MTNERYAFIEDVTNRKNVAKSGGKKGKSRYGCTLPSDYMSTKEKRDQNSRWISVTYNRPISYDKFLAYSDEDKKTYLQTLIDKYGGSTDKIAKMFGTTEAKIKMHRQELGVCSPIRGASSYGNYDVEPIWSAFLSCGEFLRKPMSLNDFKALDWYDQKEYIRFLTKTMNIGVTTLSTKLFGYSAPGTLMIYLDRNKIPYAKGKAGVKTPKENIMAFEKWLKEGIEEEEEEPVTKKIDETSNEEEKVNGVQLRDIFDKYIDYLSKEKENKDPDAHGDTVTATVSEPEDPIELPFMNIILKVKDYDQIHDILQTLPRAKSGSITFTFGEEK